MNANHNTAGLMLHIPVSLGDLVDRISILEIKRQRIIEPQRRNHVQRELELLQQVLAQSGCEVPIAQLQALRQINARLWDLENCIRRLDRAGDADEQYLTVAREIHASNDMRHELKRDISLQGGSLLVEEKEYTTRL